MATRTSTSHPLVIAEVRAGPGFGRIGLTFCPGKQQANSLSGGWARDLDIDLQAVEDWGAAAVVTLVEKHELQSLAVEGIGEAVAARHMTWLHLPIPDVTAPSASFEAEWEIAGRGIRTLLRNGFDVLVHCKGGLGRAGTIAARLLVELGWPADDAIGAVRKVRSGAIETRAQEEHVRRQRRISEGRHQTNARSAEDRALGALMGLAVGDAVGTTLEFKSRDSYPRLTDLVGGGPFRLKPGEWTDDTAMALALADSLIDRGSLDEADLMTRFVEWWKQGRYSCTGTCFDIGVTTRHALQSFLHTGEPIAGSREPNSAGNGSLMRLAPAVLHTLAKGGAALRDGARRQSATTHAAAACLDACEQFAWLLYNAVLGAEQSVLFEPREVDAVPEVSSILAGSWRGKLRSRIRSSGYVVHSLEAAIWSVARTTSFRDAVLLAANLGEDADTTAAIAGQLAGAIYGMSGIPEDWRRNLAWSERIETMGRQLLAR